MIPEEGTPANFKRAVLAQDVDINYILVLLIQHVDSTGFCSIAGHMRSCSKTYAEIMRYGKLALPGIFTYMYRKRKMGRYSGMSIMLLLTDITHESPYVPDREGGFSKYTVSDVDDMWLHWGYKHGYLNKVDHPLLPQLEPKKSNRRSFDKPKRWWEFWKRE